MDWLVTANGVAVTGEPYQRSVADPCFVSGYSEVRKAGGRPGSPQWDVRFEGTGRYSECKANVLRSLINTGGGCPTPPCSFGGTYQPVRVGDGRRHPSTCHPTCRPTCHLSPFSCHILTPPVAGSDLQELAAVGHELAFRRPLVGQSFLFDTVAFFGLKEHAQLSELQTKAEAWCGLSWSEVNARYPDEPIKYRPHYCFQTAYFVGLLHDGYGIRMQGAKLLWEDLAGEHQDQSIAWPVGAILRETCGQRAAQGEGGLD